MVLATADLGSSPQRRCSSSSAGFDGLASLRYADLAAGIWRLCDGVSSGVTPGGGMRWLASSCASWRAIPWQWRTGTRPLLALESCTATTWLRTGRGRSGSFGRSTPPTGAAGAFWRSRCRRRRTSPAAEDRIDSSCRRCPRLRYGAAPRVCSGPRRGCWCSGGSGRASLACGGDHRQRWVTSPSVSSFTLTFWQIAGYGSWDETCGSQKRRRRTWLSRP
jgi:hypothetical protein